MAVGALLLSGAPAVADDGGGETVVTTDGTLLHVVMDGAGDGHDGELEITTFVELDGAAIELSPDAAVAVEGTTGTAVEVTLEAPAGTSVDDAVEAYAAGAAEVDLVAVAPADGASQTPYAAAAASTRHTLTVLPVYWSSTDGTSVQTLANLATTTAQYWSEQSGGRVETTTAVRSWAKIPDPGNCNTSAIWTSAMQAHGLSSSSATSHVLVYFPHRADCGGWAGLASIGGGAIWVNGSPMADVFAHEFGHNLGLGHANTAACRSGGAEVALAALSSCTVQEYADRADVMGYATSSPSGNLNSAFADHLGWTQVRRVSSGETFSVDLAALSSGSGTRALMVPTPYGDVYLDFRPASGRDTRMPAWAGVQAHLRTKDTTYGYPTTYLLDLKPHLAGTFSSPALGVGAAWQIPGTTTTVTLSSAGTTARIDVSRTPVQRFTDVPVNYMFFNEISWLADRQITTGLGDGSFGAATPITREAMGVFLYRYAGVRDYVPPAVGRFWDVPPGRYFYTEISWLAEQGITTGLGDGSFGALDHITREAIAAFLFRFAGDPSYVPPTTARFPDVPVTHRFYREISWLAELGITKGQGDGTFGTVLPATRQDVAAFLYRLDRVLNG